MTDSTRGTDADKPQGDWPFQGMDDTAAREPQPAATAPGARVPAEPEGAPSGAPSTGAAGEPGSGSRRRTIVIASAAAAVVIIGGVAAALGGVFDGADPVPAPAASTVTIPSPTATVEPAARTPISTFADALPPTVLSYALMAITPHAPYVASGALEAYKLDYSDGGSGAVTLYAGQFETPPEATAAYTALVAAATAAAPAAPADAATPSDGATASGATAEPTSGSVDVGGQPVGAWTVTTAADGTGTATWTNGTALFQAVGPADVVADFYQAFPL